MSKIHTCVKKCKKISLSVTQSNLNKFSSFSDSDLIEQPQSVFAASCGKIADSLDFQFNISAELLKFFKPYRKSKDLWRNYPSIGKFNFSFNDIFKTRKKYDFITEFSKLKVKFFTIVTNKA